MAEDNDDLDNNDNGKAAKRAPMGARTKLIMLLAIGLLVIAGSIGGTLFLLGVFDGTDDEDTTVESDMTAMAEPAVVNKPRPAMYFPIKPAFIVNFPSRGRQHYLQVDMTVMTRDPDVFTGLQTHMPLVKNRLVMLIGGEVYEELQTDEGKELLRQKSMDALQEIMQQELGKTGVEQVLFTNFVMQ